MKLSLFPVNRCIDNSKLTVICVLGPKKKSIFDKELAELLFATVFHKCTIQLKSYE